MISPTYRSLHSTCQNSAKIFFQDRHQLYLCNLLNLIHGLLSLHFLCQFSFWKKQNLSGSKYELQNWTYRVESCQIRLHQTSWCMQWMHTIKAFSKCFTADWVTPTMCSKASSNKILTYIMDAGMDIEIFRRGWCFPDWLCIYLASYQMNKIDF